MGYVVLVLEQRQLLVFVLGVGAGLFFFHALLSRRSHVKTDAHEVVGGVVGFEAFEDGLSPVRVFKRQ